MKRRLVFSHSRRQCDEYLADKYMSFCSAWLEHNQPNKPSTFSFVSIFIFLHFHGFPKPAQPIKRDRPRKRTTHIGVDFRKNLSRTLPVYSWNLIDELQIFIKRAHSLLNLLIESGNRFIQIFHCRSCSANIIR